MEIEKASFEDLQHILDLQKLSYLSEAELLNNFSIQPLTQTLAEMQNEYSDHIFLKLVDENNKIIGSVRAYEENGCVNIGKLIVHPDCQNKGFGAKLLKAIESYYDKKTYELYTSSKSIRNLYLYKKYGYKEVKREKITDDLEFVFLQKINT